MKKALEVAIVFRVEIESDDYELGISDEQLIKQVEDCWNMDDISEEGEFISTKWRVVKAED